MRSQFTLLRAIQISKPVQALEWILGRDNRFEIFSRFVGCAVLALENENRFILIDHNGSELLDTNKSKTGPSYSSSLENKSLLSSDSNTTYQVKLETFDHFNLIKESINETRPVYAKDNLDDQKLMF